MSIRATKHSNFYFFQGAVIKNLVLNLLRRGLKIKNTGDGLTK